jgi:hypothetical protein
VNLLSEGAAHEILMERQSNADSAPLRAAHSFGIETEIGGAFTPAHDANLSVEVIEEGMETARIDFVSWYAMMLTHICNPVHVHYLFLLTNI